MIYISSFLSLQDHSTPILDSTLLPPSSSSPLSPRNHSPTPSPTPYSTGPSPVTLPDINHSYSSQQTTFSKFQPNSLQYNSAPQVRVQVPDTPEGELERTWRMDSFENYDDEEEEDVSNV